MPFSYKESARPDPTQLLQDAINRPHLMLFKTLPQADEKAADDLHLFDPTLAHLYWIDKIQPRNRVSAIFYRGARAIAHFIRERRAADHYHREFHPETQSIYLLSLNGEYRSFVWHATPAEMNQAVRWGFVKCYSVTGKAIAALGKYRQIEEVRVSKGYVSNRYPEKHALLNLYQDRLDALHRLEILVNQQKTEAECAAAFKSYIARLQEIQNHDYFANTCIDDLDVMARENIRRYIGEDILEAGKYNNRRAQEPSRGAESYLVRFFNGTRTVSDECRATGAESVLTFVKRQMYNVLREMQGINQNMTYSLGTELVPRGFAATRGDMNSCIEDACEIINKYAADPHNAITNEHHGLYQDGAKGIVYDPSQHGLSAEEHDRALLAIANIIGLNAVEHAYNEYNQLEARVVRRSENGQISTTSLEVVKATKWHSSGTFWQSLKKTLAWPVNVIMRIAFGVLDIALGVLFLPFPAHILNRILNYPQIKYPRLKAYSDGLGKLARFAFEVHENTSHIVDLRTAAQFPNYSLGQRLAHFAVVIIKNTVVDLFKGIYFAGKELSYNLWHNVRDDIESGLNDLNQEGFNDHLIRELHQIENNKLAISEKIIADFNVELQAQGKPPLYTPKELAKRIENMKQRFAAPDYVLTDGDWHEALSMAVHGTEEFVSIFMHHIYAKHPFAGLLFSTAFATGGFAILAPNLVGFLGAKYASISLALGKSMAKGSFEAAIAGGSTQAEILAPVWELILNGPESWLVKGAKQFEQDPTTAIVYTFAAIGFGGLLAYGVNIPGLTPMLLEGMGTFPAGALLFAGAKVGLLVVELVQERNETGILNEEKAEQIRVALTELYGDKLPADDLQRFIDTVLSEENVLKLMRCPPYKQLLEGKRMQGQDVRFSAAVVRENWDALPPARKHAMERQFEREYMNTTLLMHQSSLPDLSRYTRHHLARRIDRIFAHDRKKAESLKSMLYPEAPMSIILVTIDVLATFATMAMRLVAAATASVCALILAPFDLVPYQMIWKPLLSALTDAGRKLETDFTRIIRAISKQFKTDTIVLRTMNKSTFDVIVNSLIARPFTILMGAFGLYRLQHVVSDLSYRFSGWLDSKYEATRQWLSTMVDWFVRDVTKPHVVDTSSKISSTHVDMYLSLGKPRPLDSDVAEIVELKLHENEQQRQDVYFPVEEDRASRNDDGNQRYIYIT